MPLNPHAPEFVPIYSQIVYPPQMFILYATELGKRYLTYDCVHKFIVCAQSELAARMIAQAQGRDEVHFQTDRYNSEGSPFWTDSNLTNCVLLSEWNTEGVVIQEFRSG